MEKHLEIHLSSTADEARSYKASGIPEAATYLSHCSHCGRLVGFHTEKSDSYTPMAIVLGESVVRLLCETCFGPVFGA